MVSTAFPEGWKQTHIIFCWRRSCRTWSQRYLGTSYCDARLCFRSQDTPGPCCHALIIAMNVAEVHLSRVPPQRKVCRGKLAKQGCLSFANNWGADAEKRIARPNAPVDQDNKWQTAVHTWQQQLQTKACTTFRRVVGTENTKPSKNKENSVVLGWGGRENQKNIEKTIKTYSMGFGIGILPKESLNLVFFVVRYFLFFLYGALPKESLNIAFFFLFFHWFLHFLQRVIPKRFYNIVC